MSTFDKTKLIKRLSSGPLQITFTKANGKTRVLKATLVAEDIPATEGKLGGETRGVMTVYGIKEKGWRSITVANITAVDSIG